MKHYKKKIYAIVGIIVIFLVASLIMLSQLDQKEIKKDSVYLILKTNQEHIDFWVNIENGARVAATELGAEVTVIGPTKETDIDGQILIVEEIINRKPEAIAIAACEYEALSDVCQKAMDKDITLITYDSDVYLEEDHSFVGTDNFKASQRLAYELANLLDHKGKIAIIAHVEGVDTSIERVNGFLRGMNPYPEIEINEEINYCGDDINRSYVLTKKIIEENPDLTAIYGTNEVALIGIAQAIKNLGLQESIHVVGFDISEPIVEKIEENIIDVTMVQQPFNIGYLAIKEALEVKEGKGTSYIYTDAIMINKENLFRTENQKFIVPSVGY